MPYVMMPVPEEHVEAVMDFVLRAMARASIVPWDAESIAEVFDEIDEASKSILSFVSRSVLADKDLPERELATMMQLGPREVAGIMNELVNRSRNVNRPNLVASRTLSERLPNGRTRDARVYFMDVDIAQLVHDAEQAELRDARNPLREKAE